VEGDKVTGWFRWWNGSFSDAKFGLVAMRAKRSVPDVLAVWIALLEHAAQCNERGCVTDCRAEEIAWHLRIEGEAVSEIIAAMTDRGMIVDGRIEAWERRQPSREDAVGKGSKPVAERVAAHRERKKQEQGLERNADVTQCNADVTPQNRTDTEQNRTDTESTTQQPDEPPPEKPKKRAAVAAVVFDPVGFLADRGVGLQEAADYVAVRKGKKAPATETALKQIEAEARKAGVPLQAAVTECCARGWAGFKAEWLTNSQNGARAGPPPAQTGRQARIDNYWQEFGGNGEKRDTNSERDITGESIRIT
jgi:hypothetical protein